jgi:predicted nucleotidyltransferase
MTDQLLNRRKQSSENLNSFLVSSGIELSEITAVIGEIDEGATAILGGSVADGFFNGESDLDVMIIGAADGILDKGGVIVRESDNRHATWRINSDRDIQVEVYPVGKINELAKRIASSLSGADRDQIYYCSLSELKLLHRLWSGVPLVNPQVADEFVATMRLEKLPRYLVLQKMMNYLAFREDVVGQLSEGRSEDAIWMSTFMINELVCALNAAMGETNMNGKWQWRLLSRHRDELGGELMDELWAHRFSNCGKVEPATVGASLKFAERVVRKICSLRPTVVPALRALQKGILFSDSVGKKRTG